MKERTRNFKPYNCEMRGFDGGFEWTFMALSDDRKTEYNIKLHFDRWWLIYLARDLRKALEREEDIVAELRSLMAIEAVKPECGE